MNLAYNYGRHIIIAVFFFFFEIAFSFSPPEGQRKRTRKKVKQTSFYQGRLTSEIKHVLEPFTVRTDFKMKLPLAFKWKFQGENVNKNVML